MVPGTIMQFKVYSRISLLLYLVLLSGISVAQDLKNPSNNQHCLGAIHVCQPPQPPTPFMLEDGFSVISGATNATVNPLPVANAGPDASIPFATATILSGSASGGSGNYAWMWNPIPPGFSILLVKWCNQSNKTDPGCRDRIRSADLPAGCYVEKLTVINQSIVRRIILKIELRKNGLRSYVHGGLETICMINVLATEM